MSNKKELTNTCNSMDKTQKHAEQKRTDFRVYNEKFHSYGITEQTKLIYDKQNQNSGCV